jgi:hypothetical protein
MVALDGRVLDGAVHPLDLTACPGTARLGQAMLDLVLRAGPVERMPAIEAWLVALGPVSGGFGLGFLVDGRASTN